MEFNGIDPVARLMAATVEVDIDTSLADPDAATGQRDVPKEALTVIVAPTADGAPLTYPAGQPMNLRQIRIPTEPGSGYIRRLAVRSLPHVDGGLHREGRRHDRLDTCIGAGRCLVRRSRAGLACLCGRGGSHGAGRQLGAGLRHRDAPIAGCGALGAAIVLILISLPFLALWVVINVYRGRRKFEPAFLSWIAALLFATMTIRNFLPGSPPAGSWVDIAVVIWVMIALTVALCFGVGPGGGTHGRFPVSRPLIRTSRPGLSRTSRPRW